LPFASTNESGIVPVTGVLMMKIIQVIVLLALVASVAVTQNTTDPRVKRPRTPDDYQAGTLKELAAKHSSADSRGNKMETMVVDPDFSPTRVRVSYAGHTRRLPEANTEVVRQWARLYAGAPETYKPYEIDVLFAENGKKYWLTFTQKKLTAFWDSGEWDTAVDLFVIRMGAIKTATGWEPVLLVENFQKVK
jgi:hypothetical protein